MIKILSFDEWVLKMYDYNGNGKIDKAAERMAYNRALNNKNHAATEQQYAQYVALAEAANQNERAAEQQQQLITAAGAGNEAATTLLTGESKAGSAKKIIIVVAAAAVVMAFVLTRKK